jgi:Tol biopolymer transport system component
VRDLVAGTTVRVSASSNGVESNDDVLRGAVISAHGRYVVFCTAAGNLVPGDGNGVTDVFLHDRDPDGDRVLDEGNGTTERISLSVTGGDADAASFDASVSGDGDVVAFTSRATNLVPMDGNGRSDVFVRVRSTGVTTLMSTGSSGIGGDDDSFTAQVSMDGSAVVFASMATNLVPGDLWPVDIFVRDRLRSRIECVSRNVRGHPANAPSNLPTISGDGRLVLFRSTATNLHAKGGSSSTHDLYLKDRFTGAIDCMTAGPDGLAGHEAGESSLSFDGSTVVFLSDDPVFVPLDVNGKPDVFVRDVPSGSIACASLNDAGIPPLAGSLAGASVSDDGRFVAFASAAADLVHDDGNGMPDVFVNDLANAGLQASCTIYGVDKPGTGGMPPVLESTADPEFGASLDLLCSNPWGHWTVGFLFYGLNDAWLPQNDGGILLVDITFSEIVVVAPLGWECPMAIPYDPSLCGVEYYMQMVIADPAAVKGLAYSRGLKMTIGR